MRITPTRVLVVLVLLTALLVAADSASAAEVGTRIVDCFPSQGGGYEVCM